ncbi:Proton-coupled folate transporter [Halotydeus destructor]|nr:Proton-coupled folate transporter [Halotydeus destructor]
MSEILQFVRSLKVEPFLFLLMLSLHLKSSIFTQFVQDKTCMLNLGLSLEQCFNISTSGYEGVEGNKNYIIETSNNYHVYVEILKTVPGVVASLFVGSWSDKVLSGRKWMMMIGAFGIFIDSLIGLLNLVYFDLPTPFLLLTNIPSAMLGGFSVAYTAIYSYAAVNTLPQYRAFRFTLLEVSLLIGLPISKLIVGQLLDSQPWIIEDRIRNYFAIYLVDMIASLSGILWVLIMIDETRLNVEYQEWDRFITKNDEIDDEQEALFKTVEEEQDDKSNSASKKMASLFDVDNVKTMRDIFVKNRPAQRKSTLSLVMLAHMFNSMAKMASRLLMYQFCQVAFKWTFKRYSNVTAMVSTVDILVTIITVPILKKFKVQDLTLCIIGTSSSLVGLLIRGAVITEFGFCFSFVASVYLPLSTIASRSLLSKVVDKGETGSAFAALECLDVLVPLVSSTLFTQIFNATIDTYVGAAFLSGAALSSISLAIYMSLLADDFFA